MFVNPFTTDQNPFLPMPLTLHNGGVLKPHLSIGPSKHISINSRKLIRPFPASTK
jgi:hypothetical protein